MLIQLGRINPVEIRLRLLQFDIGRAVNDNGAGVVADATSNYFYTAFITLIAPTLQCA